MNTPLDLNRRTKCERCGGCFLPDQDGDLACLMCGRSARSRSWNPATLEARREGRAA